MNGYFRSIVTMIGQSAVQRIMGMLSTMLMARLLTASDLGLFSIVINTANSGYGFLRMGVDAALHVSTAKTHETDSKTAEKSRTLGAGLFLLAFSGLSGVFICLFAAPWIAEKVYGAPGLYKWIMLASILLFIQCMSQFFYAALVGLHRFSAYASSMVWMSVLNLLLTSLFCWAYGVKGALACQILAQAVFLLLLRWNLRRALIQDSLRISFERIWAYSLRLLRFGFPFYLSGLAAIPAAYYLQGLLVKGQGLVVMGEFRVISTLMSFVSFLPLAISPVMVSSLTRASAADQADFYERSVINLKMVWFLSITAGVILVSLSPCLIALLFGVEYMGCVRFIGVAVISTVCATVLGFFNNVSFSRMRVGFIMSYSFISSVTFFVVGLLTVREHGVMGYFISDISGALAALMFIMLKDRSWRTRVKSGRRWLSHALYVTAMSFVLIASVSAAGSSVESLAFGFVSFGLIVAITYLGVLDERERHLLLLNWRSVK